MLIPDQQYLTWQKKLSENKMFRRFWLFFGVYAVLFYGAFAFGLLFFPAGWKTAVAAIFAGFFTRYVVCELVLIFYKKQHPYQRLGFKPPTSLLFSFADKKPDAFPSQHTTAMVAISLVLWFFNFYLGLTAFLVVVLTAVARIILGYHDLADILGGFVFGLLCGFIIVFWLAPLAFTRW